MNKIENHILKGLLIAVTAIFLFVVAAGLSIIAFVTGIDKVFGKFAEINQTGAMLLLVTFHYLGPFIAAVWLILRKEEKSFLKIFTGLVLYIGIFFSYISITSNLVEKPSPRYVQVDEFNFYRQTPQIEEELVEPEKSPVVELGYTRTFTDPSLPGFEITSVPGWSTRVKPFGIQDTTGIPTGYTPTCGQSCMNVTYDNGESTLSFNFYTANDNNGYSCSSSSDYDRIQNDWVRINENTEYFYIRDPIYNLEREEIVNLGLGAFGEIGKQIENTPTYEICSQGSGIFLSQPRKIDLGYGNGMEDIYVLMEYPRATGTFTNVTMDDIDAIVSSVKGLGELPE